MAKIITDKAKLALFQQFCAINIGSLQRQMQLSKRPVPDWVVLRTFNSIIEFGNQLEMSDNSAVSSMLTNVLASTGVNVTEK